ncbi:oligosaccharide flippase family protein [Vibrio fluvialis]|nr:oligosaccharide flippase family protein [Vibrio fluvialis]
MSSKKIFDNTLALYGRQIVLMLINLYTLRVVLNQLGVEDFGVFSVITGVVTLCTFLTAGMTSATQRYFSYALGKKNTLLLRQTFTVNVVIYAILITLVVVLLSTVGLWYVKGLLVIPEHKTDAALKLYFYATATLAFTITSSPFIAIIISHENMKLYAVVSLFEAFLKLGAAMLLPFITGGKLEGYGLLLLIVASISTIAYVLVCIHRYDECQFKKLYWNSFLIKEVIHFTGWSLFGQLSTVARNQSITILINQFFGPSVVAARAISLTVSTQVAVFANNFSTSLYPPIIKLYAKEKREEFYSLINTGSKISFYLMWIFALPLILEMDNVLYIWLGEDAENFVLFSRLGLIETLILVISLPIATAARAPGKVKEYELTLGLMQFSILFASYIMFKSGYPAVSTYIVAIVVNVLMLFMRLALVKRMLGFSISKFSLEVLLPISSVVLVSSLSSFFICKLTVNLEVFFAATINVMLTIIFIFFAIVIVGVNRNERNYMIKLLQRKIVRKGENK